MKAAERGIQGKTVYSTLPSTGKWFFREKNPILSMISVVRKTAKAKDAQARPRAIE